MELYDALRTIDRRGGRRYGEVAVRPATLGEWGDTWPFEPGQYVATDNGVDFGIWEIAPFDKRYLIRRCGGGDRGYCLNKTDWQPYPARYTVVFEYRGRIRYLEPLRNDPASLIDERFWISPGKKKKKTPL